MSVSTQFIDYVMEQLESVGPMHKARMFGGYAISRDQVLFAIVARNVLYFTVDDESRVQYEQHGMPCFAYDTRKKRIQIRSYYAVPEDVLTDTELLREWVLRAVQAALHKRALKATGSKRRARVKKPRRGN